MNRRYSALSRVLRLAAVFLVGFTVCVAQSGNLFTAGKTPRQVTIRTRQGQVLAMLNAPVGVVLSIHGRLTSGMELAPDAPVVFEGDVTIRTKPESEMVAGPGNEQMMTSPLKLDVKDAVVELRQLK